MQWLFIAATLLTTITAAAILWRTKIELHRSVSMHVADKTNTYIIFGAASTVSIALLFVFVTQWFVPTLQLPPLFTMFFLLGQACQFVAAWVPHTTGKQAQVHIVMAYTMAVAMMPILLFLPFSPALPWAAAITIGVILAAMGAAFIFGLFAKHATTHYLVYQVGYVLCFFIALGIAAFTAIVPVTGQVKQQIIPMQAADFNDNPRIQGVIQNQGQQSQPQPVVGPSGADAGNILQPNTSSLQAQ